MESKPASEEDIKSLIANAVEKAAEKQKQADHQKQFQKPETPQHNFERPKPKQDLTEVGEHSIDELNTLAKLGKGQKTFDLWGNNITIRTLTQREELDLTSRVSSYPAGAQDVAFAVYCAAVCVETFNGDPLFPRQALMKDQDMYTFKFDYFLDNVSPMVTSKIISERISLNREIIDKANYAKKK